MSYTFQRNHSNKPKLHNDFTVPNYWTQKFRNISFPDLRSPQKRRNAERKSRECFARCGYRLVMGTLEQTIYIAGPRQGVWNTVESL